MNDLEIIAEIGVNHNGDFDTAVKLIHAARDAGATTAKFQLWKTERVYPPARWEEMKRLELTREQIKELRNVCILDGIHFLCTPDTYDDAVFLKQIGCDRLKIGSSNVTNARLLRALNELGLAVILSTGACEEYEMAHAVTALRSVPLTIMHCVSAYPAPYDQLNLLVIRQLHRRFRRPVGFSDHTVSSSAALIALGLGARTFEAHLTLDWNQRGPDHRASFEPLMFKQYVEALRYCAKALGSGVKTIMPCELNNRAEYDRFVRAQAC